MSSDEKSYVTTTKDYIAVKPDGHVVICHQDVHTGKVRVMPLMVDLDGWVRVVENTQMDRGQDDG